MSVLDGLIESYKNKIKGKLNPDELAAMGFIAGRKDEKSPKQMIIDEIAEELDVTQDFAEDRARQLNSEFLQKITKEVESLG